VEIADEVRRRFVEHEDVPASALDFIDAHLVEERVLGTIYMGHSWSPGQLPPFAQWPICGPA